MLNATRDSELLVGLPAVNVLEVVEPLAGRLEVTVESIIAKPTCPNCGERAWAKDRPVVDLVDLSGRAVSDVAGELGASWHAINDAVIAYGTALLDADDTQVGAVEALGADEVLFARLGRWRTQAWSTSIVDVAGGQVLDVIPGRSSAGLCEWLAATPEAWRDAICWAVLDLSGPWRLAFDTMLPAADQVADPFHLVKVANQRLDEVRRRVQQETLGHRGHKNDPPSTDPTACSPEPTKASTRRVERSCWASSTQATRGVRSARLARVCG